MGQTGCGEHLTTIVWPVMSGDITIRELDADDALAYLDDLVEMLRDSVDNGASVNFLADVSTDELTDFWLQSINEQRLGNRLLFTAMTDEHVVGTTMLIFATQPNQPHRAEIGKMLVHSAHRRKGIAGRLLATAEAAARVRGRTLLMLDTVKDSSGERLYIAAGWTLFGVVPDHALLPDGTPEATSFFYKVLID